MKQLTLSLCACLLLLLNLGMSRSAVDLTNTTWKTYVSDPINDTVMIHYSSDSSFVYSQKTKDTLVVSVYRITEDTLTFNDVGGAHSCPPEMVGKYHITIHGDSMKYDFISDECDGRGAVLKEISWQRVKENTAP